MSISSLKASEILNFCIVGLIAYLLRIRVWMLFLPMPC